MAVPIQTAPEVDTYVILTNGQLLRKSRNVKSMARLNIDVFDVGGVEHGRAQNIQNNALLTNGYQGIQSNSRKEIKTYRFNISRRINDEEMLQLWKVTVNNIIDEVIKENGGWSI